MKQLPVESALTRRAFCFWGEDHMGSRNHKSSSVGTMKEKTESSNKEARKDVKIKRPKPNRALNPRKVSKNIAALVEVNADKLAEAVLKEGMMGQVSPVKYLFEIAHIFPVSDSSTPTEREESLAETLLDALKIPKTPVVHDELQKDEEEDSAATQAVKAAEESSDKGEEEAEEKVGAVVAQ